LHTGENTNDHEIRASIVWKLFSRSKHNLPKFRQLQQNKYDCSKYLEQQQEEVDRLFRLFVSRHRATTSVRIGPSRPRYYYTEAGVMWQMIDLHYEKLLRPAIRISDVKEMFLQMKDHAQTEARNREPPPGVGPQRGLR
jgi:hypothetical protein